jgi:hypothetical protein
MSFLNSDSWFESRQADQDMQEKPSLEQDLLTSQDIRHRVAGSNVYAQNLYAALCNTVWRKNEAWEILRGSTWSVSWRGSGRIISALRNEGNYMDWYCSGLISGYDNEPASIGYVAEGTVEPCIRQDLLALGWSQVEDAVDS